MKKTKIFDIILVEINYIKCGEKMKRRILFYIDTLQVGGIEKVLLQYLKNMDSLNNKIILLIGHKLDELEKLRRDIPKTIEIKYILENDIYCKLKKKKSLGKLNKIEKVLMESISFFKKIKMKRKLKKIICNKDVVIDFDMTLSPFIKNIKNRKITFCHFSLKNYHRGIKKKLEKLGKRLENYDKIIVVSDEMKKEAIELFPNLRNKLVRIYNSFNFKEVYELAEKNIENELEEKYILAIGRLEETQKDFTTLIKGYSKVCNEIEEELYIIGDGRHKQQLKHLVEELKLENRVKFLGFKTNPYPYLKKASLFVHSSKFEGFGLVILEALILKRLVIATDCPVGPREILNNGKNGILTKLGDENSIAEAIREILILKKNNKIYLENSEKYIKEFDANIVIKNFERMIEEV